MSKEFLRNNKIQAIADAIRYCDGTTAGIAPIDFADRIRALDKFKPDFGVLNFTMPSGGTISLNKTGSPTEVELEYWLEGSSTWNTWTESSNVRTLTLTAGQKVYIRNASDINYRFSKGTSDYYQFAFSDTIYADGDITTLMNKNKTNIATNFVFYQLFRDCTTLVTSPIMTFTTLGSYSYYRAFWGCTSLNKVTTLMTNISASGSLAYWLYNVASTGDFYCDENLTISSGVDGIPYNWTRHDI